MKKVLVGIFLLLLVIVGGVFYVGSRAGSLVRGAVVTYGPDTVGAPIKLDDVELSLLSGRAGLTNLEIGNPEGFKSDYAVRLGEVRIALDVMSVFSDRIVIDEISIVAPAITYELGKGGSNIAVLQRNTEQSAADPGAADETATNLVIRQLNITGGKVTLAASMLGGKGVTVALPDIHMEDIGAGDEGASPAEVVKETMAAVSKAVTEAVSSGQAKELLKGAGGTAGDVGGKIQEKAGETIDKLKGLFKKKD